MSWQIFHIEPLNVLEKNVEPCLYLVVVVAIKLSRKIQYANLCTFISPLVLVLNSVSTGTFGTIYNRT